METALCLQNVSEVLKSSSTALMTLFSACSTVRLFPLIALEVYFFGIRSAPLFQVNGPQKLAAL